MFALAASKWALVALLVVVRRARAPRARGNRDCLASVVEPAHLLSAPKVVSQETMPAMVATLDVSRRKPNQSVETQAAREVIVASGSN